MNYTGNLKKAIRNGTAQGTGRIIVTCTIRRVPMAIERRGIVIKRRRERENILVVIDQRLKATIKNLTDNV